jgi:hypothetical protein
MTSPWNLCGGERMPLPDFQPMTKGGCCRIQLPSGLIIQDAAVFAGRRRAWANLPAKVWIGQDYRQKTDVIGKAAYFPVLEWRHRGPADHLSEAVVALIRGGRPGELADTPVLPRCRRAAASRSHLIMIGEPNKAERRHIEASR